MERINMSYKIIKEYFWLWLIPLGLNFLAFIIDILTGTLKLVPRGFHLKFTIPNGLPDISNILQQPQTNGIQFNISAFFLIFIFLGPFFSGGFTSSIFKILKNVEVDKDSFLADCKYFFLRLLIITLLSFMLFLVVIPAFFIFPLLGILAIFFVLYLTFFWEIALVNDDLSISEAFHKGKTFFKTNFNQIISLLILIGILSALISIPINLLAQTTGGYALAIIIWTFFGSIFSITILSLYKDLNEIPFELLDEKIF